ncbi:MAG TPA: hypothetical protein VFZ11_09280 [Gemmatimonadaceae bacterium]
MHRSLLLLALLAAPVLGAQETQPLDEPVAAAYSADDAVTIDAGMSREQVVARLGTPAAVRTSGTFTYLFFANGCPRTCGMDDLVILEDGRVSDAIFRGVGRRYTGRSSSPVGVVPAATLGARPPRATGTPRAFDAPAPSMVAMPEPDAPAPDAGRTALPAAAPAARATPAATPAPQATPAPAAAPTQTRRPPAAAFRVVPIVPDSATGAARADTTSRPQR